MNPPVDPALAAIERVMAEKKPWPLKPATGTEGRVCDDIARRQDKAFPKYGVTVEGNPLSLREWLQHTYEETLDKAIYLRRAIEELDEVGRRLVGSCSKPSISAEELEEMRLRASRGGAVAAPKCGGGK